MVSDKVQAKGASLSLTNLQLSRKINLLKKSLNSTNGKMHHLRKRLYLVTKEVKALKKAGDGQLKNVKEAERMERKPDQEKFKLRRKVRRGSSARRARRANIRANAMDNNPVAFD